MSCRAHEKNELGLQGIHRTIDSASGAPSVVAAPMLAVHNHSYIRCSRRLLPNYSVALAQADKSAKGGPNRSPWTLPWISGSDRKEGPRRVPRGIDFRAAFHVSVSWATYIAAA